MKPEQFSALIAVACLIGAGLSLYSYYVEMQLHEDESYEAMCDISERISCSKVFTSKYGRGFGLVEPMFGADSILNQPNGVLGITFYTLLTILGISKNPTVSKVQVFFALISNCLSLYLAYLLFFVLKDFCVVCISTYIINLIIVMLANHRHDAIYNELYPVQASQSSQPAEQKKEK